MRNAKQVLLAAYKMVQIASIAYSHQSYISAYSQLYITGKNEYYNIHNVID